MRSPLPDQQAVLASPARIRVVRAVPGSGKTWLVAELIRQELSNWQTKTSGIAALSFTRIGGEEIRKAVGHDLDHPHFVGTLDAFLFRYVIRPFLQRCFPTYFATPRLVPGEWEAGHWVKYGRNQPTTVGKNINVLECVFIDEKDNKPEIARKPHPTQPLRRLVDQERKAVLEGKKKLWKQTGILTHSDAALWASVLIGHRQFGAAIRADLVRRFPLIIVDELQDTGYFLGKSIRQLLEEPTVRAVLVGDPDQAIFEFNGARPDLFEGFELIEGAITFPLASSQRCPPSIAATASNLKDSSGSIGAAQDKTGKAILVRYTNLVEDVSQLVKAVKTIKGIANIKVIARQNSTVVNLVGQSATLAPKLGCQPLNHMHRAVISFRQGRQVAALATSRAALELAIFQYEGVEDEELKKHLVDPDKWKQLAVESLLRANVVPETGDVYTWQKEVGKILEDKLSTFGLIQPLQITPGKLKPQKREDWDKPCADYLPQNQASNSVLSEVPVQTVHGVKGETHDITVFVCPNANASHCPSVVWWSTDEKDREERRIAYVAMTRTSGDLILCVTEPCYDRLLTSHPEFVSSFECMTSAEYVSSLSQHEGSNSQ